MNKQKNLKRSVRSNLKKYCTEYFEKIHLRWFFNIYIYIDKYIEIYIIYVWVREHFIISSHHLSYLPVWNPRFVNARSACARILSWLLFANCSNKSTPSFSKIILRLLEHTDKFLNALHACDTNSWLRERAQSNIGSSPPSAYAKNNNMKWQIVYVRCG